MKAKTYFTKRTFLNKSKDSRLSAIHAKVFSENKNYSSTKGLWFDAQFEITGCNGTYVHLDLDIEEEEEYNNSLEKLDKLISTLKGVHNAIQEAREDYLLQEEIKNLNKDIN